MRFLAWIVAGYVAGAVPIPELADRARPGTSRVAAVAVCALTVLAAARIAGPYDAAAVAIAVVAGRLWPPGRSTRRAHGVFAAVGAAAVLIPFETGVAAAAAGMLAIGLGRRVWPGLALATLPLVAKLRGQPSAFVLAAGVLVLLLLAHRVEGSRSPAGAVRRVLSG